MTMLEKAIFNNAENDSEIKIGEAVIVAYLDEDSIKFKKGVITNRTFSNSNECFLDISTSDIGIISSKEKYNDKPKYVIKRPLSMVKYLNDQIIESKETVSTLKIYINDICTL